MYSNCVAIVSPITDSVEGSTKLQCQFYSPYFVFDHVFEAHFLIQVTVVWNPASGLCWPCHQRAWWGQRWPGQGQGSLCELLLEPS